MKQALAALVIMSISVQAAPAMAATCMAAKERAAGNKIARKMACWAKAKGTASVVDSACLAKAESKFARAFASIDEVCPGDAPTVESVVDSCVDALVADVPGDGSCAKKSALSVGKWAKRLLRCAANDAAEPGTFSTCDATADAKGDAALAKAGACASITVHADLHTDCVDAVVGTLQQATTTTSTTTTTTTVPPPCCDPACDPGDSCVVVFMTGSTTCQCIAASACSLGRCVFQPGAVCDVDGCPSGYSCFDHQYCLGGLCTDAPGSCGCPVSDICFFGVP
jgi:hypothetical protein